MTVTTAYRKFYIKGTPNAVLKPFFIIFARNKPIYCIKNLQILTQNEEIRHLEPGASAPIGSVC
jgi:hypothetical protein